MKNYLVIGGSSGIGLSISRQLANEGNKVFSSYNSKVVNETSQSIEYFKLNVLEDNINLDFLPDTIDGFVYCPGQIKLAPFNRLKPEQFREDYELQVIGAIKSLQAVLPKLKHANQSSVVLFSTVASDLGFNFHSIVSSSKGAIQGLTKALAAEYSPNIRVNAIAPSITQTPLAERLLNSSDKIEANANRHPLKRVGAPEDIAKMACFLLSSNSSWITGQIIGVDGGLSTIKT